MVGSSPRVRGKHRSRPKRQYHERIIPASAGQTASSMCRIRTRPDHPRECGANKTSTCYAARSVGSSPRVRGKRSWAVRSWASRRIIPASAGQTRKYMHERSAWPGSSPRVRGKLHALACVQALVRIIPASAGQTGHANGPARSKTDHPRECGANGSMKHAVPAGAGSSPRVRGKPRRLRAGHQRQRIIPASAGQTIRLNRDDFHIPDHPRECGANTKDEQIGILAVGSSPRVRGKRRQKGGLLATDRIIPASAGQTLVPSPMLPSMADHPRECGANVHTDALVHSCSGSSPRVRGKPSAIRIAMRRIRIIPASAGQTPLMSDSRISPPDHPRECGANGEHDAEFACLAGSSPRVRGKHAPPGPGWHGVRIIPASAGQTRS